MKAGHAPVATAVAQHLRKRTLKTKVDPRAILSCPLHLTAQEQSLRVPAGGQRRVRRKAKFATRLLENLWAL